ncbi:cell division protein ZapC [Aliivibrio kagoshimensis]|uniref:cell division protein ZapC n=1 Tax=Aliivibrio kagoshimensis TaxID=2910230 RepID=UPI003D0BB732
MLKPSDTWNWYYDTESKALMLDLGMEMVFRVNLPVKSLVDCALQSNEFTVDDAANYHMFIDQINHLPISEPRRAELALNCVAAKRFLKPLLPKSWFFDYQSTGYAPAEAEIISLANTLGEGHFIVIESCESASVCMLVDLEPCALNETKQLTFSQPIKVMHDRMTQVQINYENNSYALVG